MVVKHPNERFFTFRLEDKEWNPDNGETARKFIADFKKRVPLQDREFDSTTSTWTIERAYYDKVFLPLKEKYFVDERQGEMFAEI